jgi:TonB-linked SusC/RagA family outer membrane protein
MTTRSPHGDLRTALIPALGLAALAITAAPGAAHAQDAVLQGRVVTPQGTAVPNASVRVVDGDAGTFVNDRGRYRLTLSPGTHTVRAQALGHRPQVREVTLSAGENRTLDFTLQVDAVQLGDLVTSVEAVQTTRRQMGTDIATIDAASEVETSSTPTFSDLITARAANVTVSQTSGNVGSGSRVRIRGLNSLTQENNPLLIIDGVRADQTTNTGINRGQTFSRFDDLNPRDIESIEVVKGPTATTLYGSEAAPGVIIVTTKRGQSEGGAPRITVRTEHGSQWDRSDYLANYADVTPFVSGADDPVLGQWPVETNPVTGQVFVTDNPFEDPDSSPFRNARSSLGSVAVSGGGEEVSYYSSVLYENDEGVLPSNDLARTSLRANFATSPSEVFSVTASTGYVSSTTNLPKSGNNTSGFFTNAEDGVPISSLGSEGDCLGQVLGLTDASFCDKNGNARAGFDKIVPIISRQRNERFTGSVNAVLAPNDWLNVRATAGADVVSAEFQDAIPFDPDVPFSFAAGGENFLTRDSRRTLTGDLVATADYGVTDDLTATTTGGVQYFQRRVETVACEGRVFPNDQATACDAAVNLRGFSDLLENVEIGAFVQHRFGYRDYLFLTGALRVDDNSALGDRAEEIYSPSANASFVVSDLPAWNVDAVSSLRLRAAWGRASQSPDEFAANRTFVIRRLAQEGGIVAGLSPQDPGNPDLAEERNEEFEAGFNAGFLDDRVGLEFTWFDRTTTDLIVPQPVAPSTGFANPRFANIGEMENSGFETALNARVLESSDVSWDVRFQWSVTDPVVTDLGEVGTIFLDDSQVLLEGSAPGAYLSREIVAAERDGDGNIVPGSIEYAPGDLGDGSGRRIVGQPTPTNTQSLSSTVTLFGDLTLFTLFDRKAGHELFAVGEAGRNPGSVEVGANSAFGERWAYRQTRESAVDQAMMERDRLEGNHDAVFIHDASFIKFRELSLSYALPSSVTQSISASRARIYAGARNIFTSTDFPEPWDPESREEGARDNLLAVIGNVLPPPATIYGGLALTF